MIYNNLIKSTGSTCPAGALTKLSTTAEGQNTLNNTNSILIMPDPQYVAISDPSVVHYAYRVTGTMYTSGTLSLRIRTYTINNATGALTEVHLQDIGVATQYPRFAVLSEAVMSSDATSLYVGFLTNIPASAGFAFQKIPNSLNFMFNGYFDDAMIYSGSDQNGTGLTIIRPNIKNTYSSGNTEVWYVFTYYSLASYIRNKSTGTLTLVTKLGGLQQPITHTGILSSDNSYMYVIQNGSRGTPDYTNSYIYGTIITLGSSGTMQQTSSFAIPYIATNYITGITLAPFKKISSLNEDHIYVISEKRIFFYKRYFSGGALTFISSYIIGDTITPRSPIIMGSDYTINTKPIITLNGSESSLYLVTQGMELAHWTRNSIDGTLSKKAYIKVGIAGDESTGGVVRSFTSFSNSAANFLYVSTFPNQHIFFQKYCKPLICKPLTGIYYPADGSAQVNVTFTEREKGNYWEFGSVFTCPFFIVPGYYSLGTNIVNITICVGDPTLPSNPQILISLGYQGNSYNTYPSKSCSTAVEYTNWQRNAGLQDQRLNITWGSPSMQSI